MAYAHLQQRKSEPALLPPTCAVGEGDDELLAWGNAAASEALALATGPAACPQPDTEEGGSGVCDRDTVSGNDAMERLRRELASPRPSGDVVFDALLRLRRGQLLVVRRDPASWAGVVAACTAVQLQLVEERIALHDDAVEEDDQVWFALQELKAWMGDRIVEALETLEHGSLSAGQTVFLPLPNERGIDVTLTDQTSDQTGLPLGTTTQVVMRSPVLAVIPISVTPLRTVVRVVADPARTRVALARPTPWREVAWTIPDLDVNPVLGVPQCPEVRWT